ncbi:SMP-30/gluconolactonase/LRE family protein [Devosia nitrariae]|uniref:Gluconolactonase n=1 Tax=Devosia nitrariae TaxID=2071872 RepID=A0ABQ5W409_9HYPH|nr:SMP-30/gluconolactonase/LRE family protein [Devosia nitrariae]GLQ54421.1 gluconolactonase [Devosia nitrariae]
MPLPAVRDVRTLMTGIVMGECPRWHDGRLWFADWIGETIYALDEAGRLENIAHVASLPISIDWLPAGPMLVVNAAAKQLWRREADGSFAIHAELSALSPHPFNEIVIAANGDVYLNNIDHEFGGEFRPGFIALLKPDGSLAKVADGLAFPNGMAITPDGRTLVCAESYGKQLTAFDIAPDGSLTNRRVWAALDGPPDGICMDAEGAVWSSLGPKCVRVREGGDLLDEVAVDRMAFACMLGGADGKTLFITANEWTGGVPAPGSEPTGRIYTTRVAVPRAGQP